MRTTISTEPGSVEKASEDAAATVGTFLVVADGATSRTETGCIHGVAWYARHLVDATTRHAEETPARALALGIAETAAAHRDTCDLDNIATPNAAVAIVQARGDEVSFLVLGDVTVVVESTSGLDVVADHRVDQTALAERRAADALPSGSPEKAAALVKMKRAELSARNIEGGYWVAAADPAAVDNALVWSVPRSAVRRCAVLTDGAARIVDPFAELDWGGVLDLLAASGTDELIRWVRRVEHKDSRTERWPRNKVSDDATVAYVEFS